MGREAWSRPGTDAEVASMAALLDDALRSGSLGLSGNWFDTDRRGELVPSRLADDAELEALLSVLARYPGALLQTIIRDDANAAPRARPGGDRGRSGAVARRWHRRGPRRRAGRDLPRWRRRTGPSSIGIRVEHRHRGHPGLAPPRERSGRSQGGAAGRPVVAGAGPPRLGPSARRAELVPRGSAPPGDPERSGGRARTGGDLAAPARRRSRSPPV